MSKTIKIVLKQLGDGPSHEFIEVEDSRGKSINIGHYEDLNGFTYLTIPLEPPVPSHREQVLRAALLLAKNMIVANGLDLPNTMSVINSALSPEV